MFFQRIARILGLCFSPKADLRMRLLRKRKWMTGLFLWGLRILWQSVIEYDKATSRMRYTGLFLILDGLGDESSFDSFYANVHLIFLP